MGGSTLVGHLAEWPVGRYHKAHYHTGGAILLILRTEGYTLMWPQEAGIRPYQSGNGDQVVKVNWREGSVLNYHHYYPWILVQPLTSNNNRAYFVLTLSSSDE